MKFLFPNIPQKHPANGAIIMNLVANFWVWAMPQPSRIKAMNELQRLNPKKNGHR